MARIAASALERVDSFLKREKLIPGGVNKAIRDIKNELESMKSFLQDADARKEAVGMLVKEVREIDYDLDAVLDELMLHFGQSSRGKGCRFPREVVSFLRHLRAGRRIAAQVHEIRAQIYNLSIRRSLYDVNSIDEETPANATRYRLHDTHSASIFAGDDKLVGIANPREELVSWLLEGNLQLEVISVVGMGGSGKTTLVRNVYDDRRVRRSFSCHAWITLTQSFSVEELLRSMLYQVFEERNQPLPGSVDIMDHIQLSEILGRYLRERRYVIVFDNVWDVHAWDFLKYALPDNDRGSRILIATRIREVASSFIGSSGHIYNLPLLSHEDAYMLFCKKAFRTLDEGRCPQEMENISQEIVQICEGLPLALVTIGGLLLMKEQTVAEWTRLREKICSELAKNPGLGQMTSVLLLGYNDLPYYLRSCFLYFSIFPQNYSVERITLIRLWIAEGFIRSEAGRSLEDVAEDYLNNLIDRSMVQVADFYDYGRVRSCRVHDLFRDIIVLISEEENFSLSLDKQRETSEAIRRLSLHSTNEDVLQTVSPSHLRALFMFGSSAIALPFMRNFISGIRLLRVLDLEDAPIENFPAEVANLVHLRYLSLRNTKINKIPKSLGKLKYLETLDLKGTYVSELPTNILNLKSLRHLLAYHYYMGRVPPYYHTFGVKGPLGIGSLKELQKLSYLEASQGGPILQELENLTQLRRLGIVKLKKEDGIHLCSSVEKMPTLRSFSVSSVNVDEILELQSLVSPPPLLERLYLRGPLEKFPEWLASLNNLVRLRLRWSRLREDSVEALQGLQNLVELALIWAYDGEKLCFKQGAFQKLRIIILQELDNLKYAAVEGAMPNLQKMYIRSCQKLETVPSGIEHLMNLKELQLLDMPEAFVSRLKNGGTDYLNIKHIPLISSYNHQNEVYEEL